MIDSSESTCSRACSGSRSEVAFDPVEPEAVGRQQQELCVGVWQPGEHVRRGVSGKVVADDVEPLVAVVEIAQLAEEVEEVGTGAAAPLQAVQPVGVEVVAAEQVADPLRASVGRAASIDEDGADDLRQGASGVLCMHDP